jgi:predicted TPR repeat methyltransferase
LFGAELAERASSLVGVDISSKMLDVARQRDVYTELICCDLMSALERQRVAGYDAVSAADVFIYVGKLDDVVAAVRRTLRVTGLFAFSAEAAEDAPNLRTGSASAGYQLTTTGRYVHWSAYLKELALDNGFEIKLLRKTRLRLESRRPVNGWITVWSAI